MLKYRGKRKILHLILLNFILGTQILYAQYTGGFGRGDTCSSTIYTTLSGGTDIRISEIIGPFCAGVSLNFNYIGTGQFDSTNVFIAQLSDTLGSFSTPIHLDSVSSIANYGNISVNLPANLLSGAAYKIRLLSTSPALVGTAGNAFTINALVTPTISISVSPNPICSGSAAVLTATNTNGGTQPNYNWHVNGVWISVGPGFPVNYLSDGDEIYCSLYSNANVCLVTPYAYSDTITMTVIQPTVPAITISVSQNNICGGTMVNFTASALNTGSNPIYHWQVNGINVSSGNSNTFSSNTLSNGQIVTCILTNTDYCVSSDSIVSSPIVMVVDNLLTPAASISVSPDSIICAGALTSFSVLTNNGGTNPIYQWQINGNNVGSNSPYFSSSSLNDGDTISCQLTSSENCLSAAYAISAPVIINVGNNLLPSLSIVSNTNGICQGEQIIFEAINIQNQGSIPGFQWKKNGINIGYNFPQLITSNLLDGDIITCELTSSLSCASPSNTLSNSITVNVIPNQFNLAFSANNTNLAQAPFIVNFTNTTPNLSDYNFTWYFGDGTTSNDVNPLHAYSADASYSISLVAESLLSGCSDTLVMNNYITCSNTGSSCNHQTQISPSGPLTTCQNGTLLLTLNTNAPNPSYQWMENGVIIGGATLNTLTVNSSGNYSVLVYSNGGCPIMSNLVSLAFTNPPVTIPQINTIGSLLPCGQGNITLSTNAPGASLTWNTGATASSITVNQAGSYFVTANFGQGCVTTSQIINLGASSVINPGICMVTVDSLFSANTIVWETPLSTEIDSFYIYIESNQPNIYQLINRIGYNELSQINDINATTAMQGYRYKLAVKDFCGGITALSDHHKTIHLKVFPGINNTRQLSWSNYEGLNFNNYQILRKLPGQSFQQIATVSSNLNTYTDLNPVSANAKYRVEIELPQACNSVDRLIYAKSRSNASQNQALLVTSQGLNENMWLSNLSINPNPSNGNSELFFESVKAQKIELIISNAAGQLINQLTLTAKSGLNKFKLDMEIAGLYLVEIKDENHNKMILKWIVR